MAQEISQIWPPNLSKAQGLKVYHLKVTGQGPEITPLTLAAQAEPLSLGGAYAIGSFDGVHRGHQTVIDRAKSLAHEDRTPCGVITFDPHPQSFLNPKAAPFRLMSLGQQIEKFQSLGVERVIILGFDASLSQLSPYDFAKQLLVDTLGLDHIVAGFDFSFGAKGAGKAADLLKLGQDLGFESHIIDCQYDQDGQKLSSSQVRDALQSADLKKVEAIVGHAQAYQGVVIKGDQKGRTIGFPTLNIELGAYQRPKYGVYVSKTRLPSDIWVPSVTNIGVRPTVDGLSERFETHMIDQDLDLYGQVLEVALLDYVRPEMKFSAFEALKAQIASDVAKARAYHLSDK